MRSSRAFLIGAGAAFLFDPRQGRRRRHVLRDRSLALVRRSSRVGVRKARFAGGHARGALAVSRRVFGTQERAADDATLVQRIRSEAFRGAMDYYSHTRHAGALMEKLWLLEPRTLACMHGSAWRGDGAKLLRALCETLTGALV